MGGGIFLADEVEPVARHLDHVAQVGVNAGYLVLDAGDELVGFVLVEFKDAGHLDFHQSEDVVFRYLADELRVVGSQAFVDVGAGGVHVGGLFEGFVFIDALFDEDAFERGEVEALREFATADEEFAPEEFARVVDRVAEHVAHAEKARVLVVDDAAVG